GGRRRSAAERTERVKPHTPREVLADGVWRRCPVSSGATAMGDVTASFPAGCISRAGFDALLTSPGGAARPEENPRAPIFHNCPRPRTIRPEVVKELCR